MSKSGKSAYFHHVFAYNFLVLKKKFVFSYYHNVLNFECKCAQNGSEKRKTFFVNIS
jgi:hypothetical protein